MTLDNLSIFDLAQQIKKRPQMYLGETVGFTNLVNLINGYSFHKTTSGNPPFEYFNVWVKKKFDKWGSNKHWTNVILQENKNNEEKAFRNFFELLEEFNQIKPLNIFSTNLTEDNFALYYSKDNRKGGRLVGSEGRLVIDPAPYHIKVVQFDYCTHSYHFDFNYAVLESVHGKHEQSFHLLDKCFQFYIAKYGDLRWGEIPKNQTDTEFQLITQNCDHGNALHHYMDGTNDHIK